MNIIKQQNEKSFSVLKEAYQLLHTSEEVDFFFLINNHIYQKLTI